MNKKSNRGRWGTLNQRRLRVEPLELRAMLAGFEPSVVVLFDTSDLSFNDPREGSNVSPTDHINEWRMVAELSDTEGGDFLLEMSFGNAIFGEPGDASFTVNDLPPEDSENPASLFRWEVSFDWDSLPVAFLDTHDSVLFRQIFVRATDLDPLDPDVSTHDTEVILHNSMPFFGAVTATPDVGGGGCGGSSGVTVAGTFTEYGIGDAVTLRVHWGDGNTDIVHNAAVMSNQQNVPFSVNHTYAAAGSYNITWDVFDDEGGTALLPTSPASNGGFPGFMASSGGGPSVCLDGDVLTVIGSTGSDVVTITQPTGLVRVESSFLPMASEFPLASVQSILVQLGAGDDTLVSFSTLPMVAVGGDGNDILTGGSGRNVLIGGLGADLLTGGDDEDILVDGATTHDDNAVALLAILAEWISNHSFVDRMKNLTNGSGSVQGLNETTEGSYFLVPDGNDGEFDFLIGGDGKDWIIRRHK